MRSAGEELPDLYAKARRVSYSDDMDRQKMVALSVIEKATDTMTPKKSRFSKKILILMGLIGGGLAVSHWHSFLSFYPLA